MNTIENLLTMAQRRLAELEGEAEHLRALIRLYAGSAQTQGTKPSAEPRAEPKGGRSRGVSTAWKPLGKHLVEQGTLDLDELEALSDADKLGFSRTQIKNQMHNWKRRGFVSNPRPSVFSITQAGTAEMMENKTTNGNGANHELAPPPDFENRDEPESASDARFDLLNPNKAAMPGGGT